MIGLLRVDHRLLHGAIIFNWVPALHIEAILLVGRQLDRDPVRRAALRLNKPPSCELWMAEPKQAVAQLENKALLSKRTLVSAETVEDAVYLAHHNRQVRHICLGNTLPIKGSQHMGGTVFLTQQELSLLASLVATGVEVELRSLPGDEKRRIPEIEGAK